jgi:hypothetical protein
MIATGADRRNQRGLGWKEWKWENFLENIEE